MTAQEFLSRLEAVREVRGGWAARCPAHPDEGCTLAAYAEHKQLPVAFLRDLGVSEIPYHPVTKKPAVKIPFFDVDGTTETSVLFRIRLTGKDRFRWKSGHTGILYGLSWLDEARSAAYVVLVEGPSDVQTLRLHGVPAIGLPSAGKWVEDWATYLASIATIYVVIEPGEGGQAVRKWLRTSAIRDRVKLITQAELAAKDVSELHLMDREQFFTRLQAAMDRATPWTTVEETDVADKLAELRTQAAAVLSAADPLGLVREQLGLLGYAGDLSPALTLYLAVSTRLLKLRPEAMPCHVLILGPTSIGKSWTWKVVKRLLPEIAFHEIPAGSPRVFIYDDAPLQHRVCVFGEADSLPQEDGTAMSAMRNMLTDGEMSYDVVVKDPHTGKFKTDHKRKAGPTLLLTTSTRHLAPQMDSRLFSIEPPDDPGQIRAALDKTADLELDGQPPPEPALVAYQELLQIMAPWDVRVPFARVLGTALGKRHVAPRVLRDFPRILSLIKAVAILCFSQRERDANGRLVATIGDYATVRGVLEATYEAAASDASPKMRATVLAVARLIEAGAATVTTTALAKALGISQPAAWGRAQTALKKGYLANREERKGFPARLIPSEPLPDPCGLPSVQEVAAGTGTEAPDEVAPDEAAPDWGFPPD